MVALPFQANMIAQSVISLSLEHVSSCNDLVYQIS